MQCYIKRDSGGGCSAVVADVRSAARDWAERLVRAGGCLSARCAGAALEVASR